VTIENLSENALKVVMPAKLTAADVAQVARQLDDLIAQHSRIRLMFDLTHFGGWENLEAMGAHFDQLKFIPERAKHIERIAVIIGYPWQQQFLQMLRNVLPTQVQAFEAGAEGEATQWLLQGS
jgi:stage II sporulation SpoAA-like protein